MDANPFSLVGKTILVTGASSGIGRGIALCCANMGATLVLTARNEERLKATLGLLKGDGHSFVMADLIDEEQIERLAVTVPVLDGVVQCAGIGSRIPCKSVVKGDLDVVINTNFCAPALLQAALLRNKKIAKSASIVYIASAAANMPAIGNAVYSATKGAIVSYAKCLAQELASREIRVNCISPTMVWTDLALVGATKEQLEQAQQTYPLKRYGTPEDIGNLAVYLLSDASSWMTGSNIEITGGALTL